MGSDEFQDFEGNLFDTTDGTTPRDAGAKLTQRLFGVEQEGVITFSDFEMTFCGACDESIFYDSGTPPPNQCEACQQEVDVEE